MGEEDDNKKAHNKRHAGRKFEKKAEKNKHVQELSDKQKNPKAFAVKSVKKAQKQFLRTQNQQYKKHHTPVVDRTPLEPPPILIAIVGGPQAGKSSLMRSLIKIYTKQRLTSIAGPVTVVAGKNRRITFVEVNNDINCMIDIAKVADMVLMLIDVTLGIEMEIFEFLEICRAHGTPKIMGILNHIDLMKDNKSLKRKKKALKQRFQVELYPGAKLFYLTGMIREEYMIHEIKNLSRFIAVSKFRPLTFRSSHPYVYVDRWEDMTSVNTVRQNPKCDREVVMYGYVRGTALKSEQQVHIPGCGDFVVEDVQFLPDPCPLPDHNKKRSLNAEEKLLYAPFSGVGGVVYDKDAVYIDLGGSQHGKYIMEQQKQQQLLLQQQTGSASADKKSDSDDEESSDSDGESARENGSSAVDPEGAVSLMTGLQNLPSKKGAKSSIQLFAGQQPVTAPVIAPQPHYNNPRLPEFELVPLKDGRNRRRALIPENKDCYKDDDLGEESEEEEGEKSEDEEGEESEDEEGEESEDDEGEDSEDEEGVESEDEEDANQSENEEDEDLTEGRYEEKEDLQSSSDDEDSDVDNIVPRNKMVEPPAKKRKTGETSVVSISVKKSAEPSNDAFSKIQSVLASLEEKSDAEDGGEESDGAVSDKGYSSCEDEERKAAKIKEENENEEFQRAMFEDAKDAYYNKRSDVNELRDFIYGTDSSSLPVAAPSKSEADVEEFDDFLKPVQLKISVRDEMDTSCIYTEHFTDLSLWNMDEMKKSIKDCFVTGTWRSSEDAESLLKLNDMDENLYGDYEDLETGQKFSGKNENEEEEGGDKESKEEEDTTAVQKGFVNAKQSRIEKIREKKRKLKEMFESEFEDKSDYFDSWKADMKQQAQLNRSEFESLNDDVRVLYEGFRSGMYVRMKFSKMPCEFVINFDPTYPVIVGGLLENETNNVYNRVRMKVHRWYPKILKNRDPLILSLGWRRIQTMMFYGKREDDLKLRSLKYARKYLHVEALFWGPYAPVGAGFVAFQSVAQRVPNFRIAANGVMLEADKSTKFVKKLKLIGHPTSVAQKTAFITGMFHSEIEVTQFIGAKIQTQSGIRGLLKTSIGLKGDFRAKFEDTIKMSDVVILKTWSNVEVTQYCTFVRSLLLSPTEKAHWQGMKTVAEIKKERGLKFEANPDSLYTEITKRRTYVPMPLKVPKSLQKQLPYKYKPKHQAQLPPSERVVVVKDPEEEKMDKFMHRVRELMAEKIAKNKEGAKLKQKKYFKEKREREFFKAKREKARKQAACKKHSVKHDKQ